MAYIGRYRAIVDLKMLEKDASGWSAWIMWRSAYLSMMSMRSRMLIALNWLVAFFIGRDVSRF